MSTLTPAQLDTLWPAAVYRAMGCRWRVVAGHLEMPLGELMALVRSAARTFRRLKKCAADEFAEEERARAFADLRNALRHARERGTEYAAFRAAAAILRAVLKAEVADLDRRRKR